MLPDEVHWKVTAIQNEIRFDITGSRNLRVYEWIAKKPYREQHEFGTRLVQKVLSGEWNAKKLD
jgi:hypothetical protein